MNMRGKVLFGALGVIVLFLLALQTPILRRVRGWAWDAWVGTVGRAASLGALRVENDVMQQLAGLTSEKARLTSELRRLKRVERQLGASTFSGFRQVAATVAARPIDTYRAEYVLNKGVDDGVVMGAPAVIQGSTVIGLVSELSARSSVVTLLVHPKITLPVEVAGDDPESVPARGLAQGHHFTGVVLSTVPRDTELSTGMHITTAAQEGILPHGLLVGNVAVILSAERDAYQSATIELPYDPDGLDAVMVLVPVASRP